MPERLNPSRFKSRDETVGKLSAPLLLARQLNFLLHQLFKRILWTPVVQVLLQRQLSCVCRGKSTQTCM